MTPDKLRARCAECGNDIAHEIINTGETTELESLCREMIAVGLERAAVEFESKILGYCRDPNDFMDWCQQEAQRVKEMK